MSTTKQMSSETHAGQVKAVQEPGYANVWTIQDEAGSTVARMTINADAEGWAKRIEAALSSSSLTMLPNRELPD